MSTSPRGPAVRPEAARELDAALLAAAREGRIPCAEVFRVAAAAGLEPAETGRTIERLGLKITGCQLGCFR